MTKTRHLRKDAKAPPSDDWGIHEPERFREFIEILDTCQGLVRSSSPVKIRLAIVLLDNLAEVLMYHAGNAPIEHDAFSKRLTPAQYSPSDRERFQRDFRGKIWFLSEKSSLLPADDATVLRVAHAYRNAAFHRDEHNHHANKIIVVLLFGVTCRLLSSTYGDNTTVGGDKSIERWLKSYGINAPFLEFGSASRHIGSLLLESIAVSDEDVRSALTRDLDERWQLLVNRVMKELPLPELVLDEILKTEEFDTQFDDDSASEPMRAANRIVGQEGRFSRTEYLRREREYWQTVRTAYAAFAPTFQWSGVRTMKTSFCRLGRQSTPGRVLSVYEELSDRLAKAEHLLTSAIRRSEAAGEVASDIARGK